MNLVIKRIDSGKYPGFKTSYQRLPDNIKIQAQEKISHLLQNPQPKHIRLEKLRGNNKPPVYSIHITGNHSHKISFELNGDTAVLRKAGTQKSIDRSP